jgi:hypothetical protein
MLEVEQHAVSGMKTVKCHVCGKQVALLTLPRKFCVWCSSLSPNYDMLKYFDQRINYHKNKRILDVAIAD